MSRRGHDGGLLQPGHTAANQEYGEDPIRDIPHYEEQVEVRIPLLGKTKGLLLLCPMEAVWEILW